MDSLVVITLTKGHVHDLLLWSYWLVNCNANGDNQIYISYIIMFHILNVWNLSNVTTTVLQV